MYGGAATIASVTALLGTGAFSAAQIRDRDVDIAVTNDAEALVGLVPNDDVGGVGLRDGELTIDIGDEDPGINRNSIYQFGLFAEGTDVDIGGGPFPITTDEPNVMDEDSEFDSAFLLANQDGRPIAVELELDIEDEDGSGEPAVVFELHSEEGREELITDSGSGTVEGTLEPGESFGVSFLVNTVGSEDGDSVSGAIDVSAGEAVTTE